MNDEMSNTNEEKLWDEKNSIEPSKNSASLPMNVECDITTNINVLKDSEHLNDTTAEKVCGIYKIVNKINGKYYVGKSNDISRRWRQHKSLLSHNIHPNSHLQNAWNKYGKYKFEFIIEKIVPILELDNVEQHYLNISKNDKYCYNLCFETLGGVDRPVPLETRKKLSETHRKKYENGYIAPMKGKFHTEEFKKKRSNAYTGNNNPNYGNHKISGSSHKCYNHTIHHFYNEALNIHEYLTMYDFYTKYKFQQSSTSRLIRGIYKSQCGWVIISK